MSRRRFITRPLVWILFAVLVGVPSVQLTRMLRAQRLGLANVTAPPAGQMGFNVAQAGATPSDPDAYRYDAVGPLRAPIAAAAVSPAGRLVAVLDEEGEVSVWDVQAHKQISSFSSKQLPLSKSYGVAPPIGIDEPLGLSVQAALVTIGGNDGFVRVWQAATGALMMSMAHSAKDAPSDGMRTTPLVDADISMEGGLVSVSGNGSLALWRHHQVVDSALVWMSRTPRGNIRNIDISADGRSIAVAADDGLYLVSPHPHLRKWTLIDTLGLGRPPYRVRFNPGGGILAAIWSEGEVRLYSAVSRDILKRFRFGSFGPGAQLAFSPDGQRYAATDGNRIIQVWSTGFGAPVALTAPSGPVRSMWFTADSKSIVIAAVGDRYLRSLPLPGMP
jgi:WD40 repeat protein